MRRNFLFRLFSVFITVFSTAVWAVETPSPVKAIYGFSSSQAPFAALEVDKLAPWLKRHGINAVFASHNEKPEARRALRQAGIPVYEEIAIFTGRTLYQNHPEWRPIGRDGKALKPDGWYHGLSPNQPGLREKRLNDFRQRLENPQLDGIWLDFIRYPVRWEGKNLRIEQSCFSEAALWQFEAHSGIALPDSMQRPQLAEWILQNHPQAWQDFKIHTITSWVKQAGQIRDEVRPEVTLGLFGVPWLEEDFNNAIKRIVAQDFTALADYVDVFSPMVYHKLTHNEVDWVGKVTRAFRSMTGKPVWPIVQAVSQPSRLSADEFKRSMETGLHASGQGIILFTAKHIENENRWGEVKAQFSAGQ